jgi:hypothetical protein
MPTPVTYNDIVLAVISDANGVKDPVTVTAVVVLTAL